MMKNLLILIISTLSIQLTAQDISERLSTLSLGEQNAFMVDHPDAEKKMVERVLDNSINDFGKVKRNRKAKEWNCMGCNIPGVGTVDIYYKIDEGKGQVTSYVFVDDGTKFISSENDKAAAEKINKLNTNIFFDVKKAVINKELEEQEDDLKDFEKDLSKLQNKNEDLHDDIEKYKEKILEAEKDIEKNLQEQEDKRMEIAKQKKVVEKTTVRLNNVGR